MKALKIKLKQRRGLNMKGWAMFQKNNGLIATTHGYRVPFTIREDMRRQDVGIFIQNWYLLCS